MEISFAPMEGVTGYIYRQVHHMMFPGADRYWAPFIAPDSTGRFKAGNLRDVLPENNRDIELVPQILANNPEAFLSVAGELAAMGYGEVDLNAGCPSGTVVAKHKGAGMLTDLQSLDSFLDTVFSRCSIRVSVKTRIGIESAEEFPKILEVYRKYPISRLIVHARTGTGLYKSPVDINAFSLAYEIFPDRVSYNGSITELSAFNELTARFPKLDSVMIGRGVVANPALIRRLKGGCAAQQEEIKFFHDTLVEKTLASGLCEAYTVGRMKEIWYYMGHMFPGGEKQLRQINKSKHLSDYRSAVNSLFAQGLFDPNASFST